MLLLDRLGCGGSYTEFYGLDFDEEFILMGHDGPGHLAIAEGRPVARALKLYHGKAGAGLSIEMKVKLGPVTILCLTQTADGRLETDRGGGRVDRGSDLSHRQHDNSRIRFPIQACRGHSSMHGAPKVRRTTWRSASATSCRASARSPISLVSSSRWSSSVREHARACCRRSRGGRRRRGGRPRPARNRSGSRQAGRGARTRRLTGRSVN